MTDASNLMVGRSTAIQAVRDLVEKVAPTDATVLISGESGSGKELVAQAIHARSARSSGPFLGVNCGALPPTLIESELFGFERGSFTGAARSHAGLVERASGGTLFLDEVTEMTADMQTRLLRFLETRRFFRVGGTQEIQTDVRVVAATNRSPILAVRQGNLREDLLYRLAVFPIALAPLRERGDDIVLLADHFLIELNGRNGTVKSFGERARRTLREYNWPGNVRELKNAIERAFIMCDHELELEPMNLHAGLTEARAVAHDDHGGVRVPIGSSLAQAERWLIEATLAHWAGNKARAAKMLGCSLKTLYNKLAAYERQGMQAHA
ncbi:MAG TPA: sigma-54 dependent transcriptional regulator [Steroidobacteraceae bacterium]|jgi:DNA-binding NtrC family response regulator|nr:sigma-54 dependent transcriptional regulator [Steroidobacteraceae bacterium]